MERFVFISDTHGNHADRDAVKAAFDFIAHFKPTIRVHGGDATNAAALRKGASEEERREDLSADVEAAVDLLKQFQPTHFLRGNHDERLWDVFASDDRKNAGHAKMLIDALMDAIGDAEMLPYHKRLGVLRFGHLKMIHGYHAGLHAVQNAARVYGSVLMGHVHTIDRACVPSLDYTVGRATGCLCDLDQTYNRAQPTTLRQAHGFAYGLLMPNGLYHVWQAESVKGQWFFPSEFRSYGRGDTERSDGATQPDTRSVCADMY